MRNLTIALDENMIELAREYARQRGMSLNSLIRSLLEKTVKQSDENWLEDCFDLMDKAKPKSKGVKWKRKDLYRV